MLDNSVACSEGGAIATMSIDDISNAAVVINSQAVAVILINVACCFSSCATCQLVDTAASELLALTRPYARQNTLLLIGPGCTVLQPQVCCAGKELTVTPLRYSLAAFRELVIDNTGKLGVLRSQAKINFSFRAAIYIVNSAYGYYYVTGNINLVVSSTNYFAISILNSIHVNRAAGCINCTVAIVLCGISINDINLAAVHVNGCAADVSKQTVAYTGDIYITVDVNRAAYCSTIICMSIKACCTIFAPTATVAVERYLHVAVNRCAACIAVDTHGGVVTLNVNINIAINS